MAKIHARFSPSKLDALSQCVRFRYDDSNQSTQDAGNEGTMLHEAFETGDLTGLSEDQASDVAAILGYVESLKVGDGEWQDLREVRLELVDRTFGYADCVLINEQQRIAHVIDAKFTRVAGDHEFQARTYSAGLIEADPGKIDRVYTHIVAPRLGIKEVAGYDAKELYERVCRDIDELYARIDDPWTPPSPSDKCGNCANALGCPALNQTAVAVARGVGLPLPSAFSPEALTSPTDRALGQVIAGALEQWAKQVKQANTEFVTNGGTIPGYSLRQRSTGARVDKNDTEMAVQILLANGFTNSEIMQACKISLNDVAAAHAEISTDTVKYTKERVKGLLSAITKEGQATYLQKTKSVSDEVLIQQLRG